MPSSSQPKPHEPTGQRLQKVLAAAGIGSRRDCEELIVQGRVEIDRQVVTELGCRVDLQTNEVRVDGEVLKRPKLRYFMLNKPNGVVTTNWDPEGRTRVIDLVRCDHRLFPIGRLDRTSEGLILLTNDGELANQLTHPRYGVSKTYQVAVAGRPKPEELEMLRKGVHLSEGVARVESVKVTKRLRQSTVLEIVLCEGRNREIRRLLARVGHKVLRLKRIAQGTVRLGNLPTGDFRRLTPSEVDQLRQASRPTKRPPGRGGSRRQRRGGEDSQDRGSSKGRKANAGKPFSTAPPAVENAAGVVLDYDEPAAGASAKTKKKPSAKRRPDRKRQGGRGGKRRQ